MRYCNNCNQPIPVQRLKVVPTTETCVSCSNVNRLSAIPVIHHKTGNEIQIVKDPEVAKEFYRLSSRVGFGCLRGLKSGKSGSSQVKKYSTAPTSKLSLGMASRNMFEELGTKIMNTFDYAGASAAKSQAQEYLDTRLIDRNQFNKLITIIDACIASKAPMEQR